MVLSRRGVFFSSVTKVLGVALVGVSENRGP